MCCWSVAVKGSSELTHLIFLCFVIDQAKNALVGTFLFLDQIVWAGRTGIYQV